MDVLGLNNNVCRVEKCKVNLIETGIEQKEPKKVRIVSEIEYKDNYKERERDRVGYSVT